MLAAVLEPLVEDDVSSVDGIAIVELVSSYPFVAKGGPKKGEDESERDQRETDEDDEETHASYPPDAPER